MSTAKINEWLETMAQKHGFKAEPVSTEVRPSEVIAGSSGVQFSYGENTYQGMEEGGDFADKARENAEENDRSQVFSGYKDGANPMQSANLGNDGFLLRYGIGFLCANYKKWSDLPDIKDLSKPSSTYLKAFKGMHKTQQYKNPASKTITSMIAKWAADLSKDLKGKGHGELVVSFQGHGDKGSIYGVDEKEITAADMLALAKKAEQGGVSITYMLDACFTGNAVPLFQDHASDAIDGKINKAEGIGNVSSAENNERANALRDQMAHARALIIFSRELGTFGTELHKHVSKIASKNDIPSWRAAIILNKKIIAAAEACFNQFEHNFSFSSRPEMQLDKVINAFETMLAYLRGVEPETSFDYNDWTGAIGKCQDELSNGGNRVIKWVNEELKALGI